jgi:peptidoglycan/LPS O-acetylase OafA/YrhL
MNTVFYFPKEYISNPIWPIMLFSFVLIPILFISSVKKFSLKEFKNDKDILSINNSLVLRGIAAITVMLHHYSLRLVNPYKICYFFFVGYLAVGIFFFLSGYASFIQLSKKGDAMWDKYFYKRLIRLLIPFWVTNFIYALLYLPTPLQFIKATITLKQVRGTVSEWAIVWFLATIIYFTILFWISYRFTNNPRNGLLIFIAGTIMLIIINKYILHHDNYWYNSSLAYGTGIWYAIYKKTINNYIIRFKKYLLPIVTLVFLVILYATTKGYQPWFIQIICCELCIFLVIILEHCTILKSSILKTIGTASWEIFLIHPLIYSAYYSVFTDFYGLSGILCILIGIILGIIINKFDEKIIPYITNIPVMLSKTKADTI